MECNLQRYQVKKVSKSLWNFSTFMETNKMGLLNKAQHLATNSYTLKDSRWNLFGQLIKLKRDPSIRW